MQKNKTTKPPLIDRGNRIRRRSEQFAVPETASWAGAGTGTYASDIAANSCGFLLISDDFIERHVQRIRHFGNLAIKHKGWDVRGFAESHSNSGVGGGFSFGGTEFRETWLGIGRVAWPVWPTTPAWLHCPPRIIGFICIKNQVSLNLLFYYKTNQFFN